MVFISLHTFQLQLCCTVTDKAAATVVAQDRVHVSCKHVMLPECFGSYTKVDWWNLVGSRVSNICVGLEVFCIVLCWGTGDRLVLALRKVLKHLTVQSLCSLDPSQWNESKQLQFTRSSEQSEMATVE